MILFKNWRPVMVPEVAEAKLTRISAKRVFNRNVKKIIDSINSKDTATLIESRFKRFEAALG